MAIHKRLKKYAVIANDRLCKVIEFSKNEAEIYVKNFIETHLSHAVLKAAGGSESVKVYFCDIPIIRESVLEKIQALLDPIGQQLEQDDKAANETGSGRLPPEKRSALKKAQTNLEDAKESVEEVKDGSDFNKENIALCSKFIVLDF